MPTFKPTTVHRQEFPRGEAHSLDPVAFDELIRSQGVQFVHFRSMGCPFGMIDPNDHTRRVHKPHDGCSRGFLYKKMGVITGGFIGNSANVQQQDIGSVEGSRVQVTFARQYDGDPRRTIYVQPFDRFYFAEPSILWPHWERIEHNISGRDRLRFPAVQIDHVIDSRLEEYEAGKDFEIRNGEIHWTGARTPGIDPDSQDQHGRVMTVWYLFQPYFYVEGLSHQARVTQTEDEAGERQVTRMPFQATLVREMVFEDEERNEESEEQNERAQRAPRDGSFAPR